MQLLTDIMHLTYDTCIVKDYAPPPPQYNLEIVWTKVKQRRMNSCPKVHLPFMSLFLMRFKSLYAL